MDKKEFKKIIRECIEEVLTESLSDTEPPLYVEYLKPMTGEEPFMLGGEKFQYCWAKYPNGKVDIGVYAFSGDICYGYQAFRTQHNLREENLREMTGTGAVAGFMGKNWVDPDPKRTKMKSIAAKSVGGKVT